MATERRNDKRVKLSMDRKVLIRESDGSVVSGRACDLGASGIGVVCPYAADIGHEVDIAFLLPVGGEPRKVMTRVQVMFCHFSAGDGAFRLGLRFCGLSADDRQTVDTYIAERLSVMRG